MLGQATTIVDYQGNVQHQIYDLLGRLTQVRLPGGNVRELFYDGESNIVRIRDQYRDITLTYSGMSRLRSRSEGNIRVCFDYDTEERLVSIRNTLGEVYRFERDPTGEIREEFGFDGSCTRYERDPAGRITSVVRPSGVEETFRYDRIGRVIEVAYDGQNARTYRYREDGAIVEAANESTTVRFERDLLGRTVVEWQGEHRVTSEFAPTGHRTKIESSFGFHQTNTWNGLGDLMGLSCNMDDKQWAVAFQRDPAGWELERLLPGGMTVHRERDSYGRTIQRDVVVGLTTCDSAHYEWTLDGRLLQLTDELYGTATFQYDAQRNLHVVASHGSTNLRIADEVGNLFRTELRSDRHYGPGGQLIEADGSKYEYDGDGNLKRKIDAQGREWHYRWGPGRLLREVIRPDGRKVEYEYDAFARRVSKTFHGSRTFWFWDGNRPLHEWTEALEDASLPVSLTTLITTRHGESPDDHNLQSVEPNSLPMTTWVFDPYSYAPAGKLVGDRQYSIVSDDLGVPTIMIDETGHVIWSARLDIFGNPSAGQGALSDCPFRYPGQYEDQETGLCYNRYRYYDPGTGQYISKDPLGIQGGLALYGYVDDPLTWTDPGGLAQTTPQGLMMAGNAAGPSPPRPGRDIEVSDDGNVKTQACDPDNGIWPQGKSTTTAPTRSGLTGTFHEVPSGTRLPDGLEIVADGADVGGPMPAGHHTIYPTRDMPFEEFELKIRSIDSNPALKINKKGKVTVVRCG
ncbi:MAG: hypothetical protein ETSY2_37470 [Candidatus Entotheonella gemina]|uniref:Uncharacterized protein n=1 Tax=Candidatus Entotheonella gemina TaxID=1429439 RepID=W4LTF1_9BACT|nr:MAG: hypothetical protein ETSY2_37470 [Candidatus Entotheonella gemina]